MIGLYVGIVCTVVGVAGMAYRRKVVPISVVCLAIGLANIYMAWLLRG